MLGIDEVFSRSLNHRQQRDYMYMYIIFALYIHFTMYMRIRVQFNCGILTNYSYIYCITFMKKRETFSFLQYFEIYVSREQMKEMKLLILVNTITYFFCTVYYLKLKR